jgi:O-antigen/teichoic acid export membrane protein
MEPDGVGEIDLATIKARSISGVATLISRTFVIRLISLAGFTILSYFLTRDEFGLFAAVNSLVFILGYFSDIGLAASLVQKHTAPNLADLRSTFTLQQLLVITGSIIMLLTFPLIRTYFQIPSSGSWVFYSLVVAFFLSSLKTIPSVLLERRLLFNNLAIVEVVESLTYWLVAILLASQGYGVIAYAWAVFLRGVVGTATIYYLSPWPIGFSLSWSNLKHLLKFGLPYQLNSFLALLKDRFMELVVWKIIGADGVGIITWARNYSEQPLRLVMDNVTKVTFPSFSRLQSNPQEFRKGIEKTLLFISLATFPVTVGLALLAPQIVALVPRYSKWEVGLLPLSMFCINTIWASISTPLSNSLYSQGKALTNTYLMIMWLSLTWIITPFMANRYGFLGVAYSSAIISCFSIVPILIVRQQTKFSLINSLGPSSFATVTMGVFTLILKTVLPLAWWSLILNTVLSALVFAITLYLLLGPKIISDARQFWHAFKVKH